MTTATIADLLKYAQPEFGDRHDRRTYTSHIRQQQESLSSMASAEPKPVAGKPGLTPTPE